MENQQLQRVKLTHPSGVEFTVLLTNYEVNRAETDEKFLNEIIEKYYRLHQNNNLGIGHSLGHSESQTDAIIELTGDNESTMSENVVSPPLASPSTKMWTDTNIRMLIELYKQHQSDFETSIKKHVWQKVAKLLSEQCHIKIDWTQCDTKFKGLKDNYKSVKKHNDTSGNNFKYWTYFELMDEILGQKPEMAAAFTCSSRRGLMDANKTPVTEISTSETDNETTDSAFGNFRKNKRKREENTAERRHKEKLERQDRFLNLF